MSRILLIDDEEDIVETIKFCLEVEGYECLSGHDGTEAVAIASREKPDLLVMDVMMPVMNGIEALKKIRKTPGINDMPVIMLTAMSEKNYVTDILKVGVNDYVIKPFDKDVLIDKVKKVIGEPKAEELMQRDGDCCTFKLATPANSKSRAQNFADIFAEIANLSASGDRKYIVDLTGVSTLEENELMQVGDSLGEANVNDACIKFVVDYKSLEDQFKDFYETEDAELFSNYREALASFASQKVYERSDNGGYVVIRYQNMAQSFLNTYQEMINAVTAIAEDEGKGKFLLSFEGLDRFEQFDIGLIRDLGRIYGDCVTKGIEVKIVVPSKIVVNRFKGFSDTQNIKVFVSEEEAMIKFEFTIEKQDDCNIISILSKSSTGQTWNTFKGIFRKIFSSAKEKREKYLIDFGALNSVDSNTLKLVVSAMAKAQAKKISVKLVAPSLVLRDQIENSPVTKHLKIWPDIAQALAANEEIAIE